MRAAPSNEHDARLDVEVSERVASRVPTAEGVVVPGAGRFSMEDDPDRVAAELSRFLA